MWLGPRPWCPMVTDYFWQRVEPLRKTYGMNCGRSGREDPEVRVEHEVILSDRRDATHILQILQEQGCDLIVMGTHGRTGLLHRLFGSVTEDVVRRAHCPVMLVKAPAQEAGAHTDEDAAKPSERNGSSANTLPEVSPRAARQQNRRMSAAGRTTADSVFRGAVRTIAGPLQSTFGAWPSIRSSSARCHGHIEACELASFSNQAMSVADLTGWVFVAGRRTSARM